MYIYICVYVCMYIYINIYIYIVRVTRKIISVCVRVRACFHVHACMCGPLTYSK